MGPRGFPWVPVGPRGSPWVPVGSRGSPWGPVGSRGFPKFYEILHQIKFEDEESENDGPAFQKLILDLDLSHYYNSASPRLISQGEVYDLLIHPNTRFFYYKKLVYKKLGL